MHYKWSIFMLVKTWYVYQSTVPFSWSFALDQDSTSFLKVKIVTSALIRLSLCMSIEVIYNVKNCRHLKPVLTILQLKDFQLIGIRIVNISMQKQLLCGKLERLIFYPRTWFIPQFKDHPQHISFSSAKFVLLRLKPMLSQPKSMKSGKKKLE